MDTDLPPPPAVRDSDVILALHPTVRVLARKLVRDCAEAGISIKIYSGFRSWEEQDELYRQGREYPGEIVTNARGGRSWHNYGRAFDVCFIRDGKQSWSGPWNTVGRIAEQLGLEWGHRFKTLDDIDHFQARDGMTLRQAALAWRKQQSFDLGKQIFRKSRDIAVTAEEE